MPYCRGSTQHDAAVHMDSEESADRPIRESWWFGPGALNHLYVDTRLQAGSAATPADAGGGVWHQAQRPAR